MSGTDAPLIAGKIHGLRVWNISWKDGLFVLTGQAQQVPWPADRPAKAKCQSHRHHRAPREGCGCGLYALHPSRSSAKRVFGSSDGEYGLRQVAGIVEAWGTVEVHESGFRAEYARPSALILPRKLARTDVGALIEQLATRYGCQVLELDGDGALHAYCEKHHVGLSASVVRELLAPKREAAEPVGTSSAAAGRRERAATMLTYALGGLWWLFWLGVAVAIVYGIVVGIPGEQDNRHRAAKDHRRLELVEQSLVDVGGGESLYIAVVKNRSRTKAALGVYPKGNFLGRRGRYLGSPDLRADVDSRPNLAPRQTGVIFDYVLPAAPGQARKFEIELRGARFRKRAKRSPVSIESTRLDRRRCLITARIRSSRPIFEAGVALVAKDRRGRLVGGFWKQLVGPLPRGISTQVVDRIPPRPCRRRVARVDVYPDLSARELGRRSR